jgi:ComF family protein
VLRGCYRYESDSPLAELIHRWKYGRDASLSGELTALFVAACPFTVDHDALIPVPLHVKRLRWRGFNQASVLAAALARHAGVEVLPHALRRIRATVPQVELAQPDRRRNVAGAFVAPQPAILNDRRLLLVDDVGTTGATVRECARVLRASGARSVDVVVLARASRPG